MKREHDPDTAPRGHAPIVFSFTAIRKPVCEKSLSDYAPISRAGSVMLIAGTQVTSSSATTMQISLL